MPSRLADASSDIKPDTPASDQIQPKLISASFDPVNFLNENLSLSPLFIAQQPAANSVKTNEISDLSSNIQGTLSRLNTLNIRYSSSLTQLTDEILRSGSRLAYEVEILRGDANGLYEVLTDTLREDMQTLVPNEGAQAKIGTAPSIKGGETGNGRLPRISEAEDGRTQDPEYITQLRMLGRVKSRLEDVINLFGEALEWPIPPSELLVASSLVSVSAPQPRSDSVTLEEEAQEVAQKFRTQILNLLDSSGGGQPGVEAASEKIESLRLLASLWKGTAEEKARTRFVDGLTKLVEERRKILDAQFHTQHQRSTSMPGRPPLHGRVDRNVTESSNPASGLFRNLQRLREEIYLD